MFYWKNEIAVGIWAKSCKILNIINSVCILVDLILYCSLDQQQPLKHDVSSCSPSASVTDSGSSASDPLLSALTFASLTNQGSVNKDPSGCIGVYHLITLSGRRKEGERTELWTISNGGLYVFPCY